MLVCAWPWRSISLVAVSTSEKYESWCRAAGLGSALICPSHAQPLAFLNSTSHYLLDSCVLTGAPAPGCVTPAVVRDPPQGRAQATSSAQQAAAPQFLQGKAYTPGLTYKALPGPSSARLPGSLPSRPSLLPCWPPCCPRAAPCCPTPVALQILLLPEHPSFPVVCLGSLKPLFKVHLKVTPSERPSRCLQPPSGSLGGWSLAFHSIHP